MTREEILTKYDGFYCDSTVFADGFDKAIIDCRDERFVYSKEKMIEVLMDEDGFDYHEAIDFLEFNTWYAYVGQYTPIYEWTEDGTI